MYKIRAASLNDAPSIESITKAAFSIYRDELHSDAPVQALSETTDGIEFDIKNNRVFVAVDENNKDERLLGAIRYCMLSNELAYIYRFSVDPSINNTGIGSDLLNAAVLECAKKGVTAICLHTNAKYYKLARYYYGKEFFVHSTDNSKGYIRALFIKELKKDVPYDISPAFLK